MEQAVSAFSKLPGIGKKTALRLVLHLLKQKKEDVEAFSNAILKLKTDIYFCPNCNNIADVAGSNCTICNNGKRDHKVICVVESLRDLIAIESTNQFFGEYHILGGVISPMEGVGPEQLFMDKLIDKANSGNYTEIIMALIQILKETQRYFISQKKLRIKI